MEPFGPETASFRPPLRPYPRNRRQTVRQRVHTPAFASVSGNSDDMVLDLSEVIDISERGASIQTSSAWDLSHSLNLCIELSETKSYVHTTGYVIWSKPGGRIGVCFPNLPDASRRKLKEWLFLNAMVGAAKYADQHGKLPSVPAPKPAAKAAPKAQLPSPEESRADYAMVGAAKYVDQHGKLPSVPAPRPAAKAAPKAQLPSPEESRADYTTTLAVLSAVQREVEAQGSNLDSALQLIAERARALSRAHGAAIALAEGREMVCRASSGDAPPIQARLDVTSGFSGYCARTGFLQRCDDAETDLRVDRESCHILGIRSMIAVPIRLGDSVVGLVEVFSAQPNAFTDRDGTILQRLADTVLASVNRATRARTQQVQRLEPLLRPAPEALISESLPFSTLLAEDESSAGLSFPKRHLALLVVAACSIVVVLAYLLTPWVIEKLRPAGHVVAASTALPSPVAERLPVSLPSPTATLDEARKRAELGDPYEQVALATRYATGEGVPQDYSLALRWYLRAAEQGHVGAQDTLGAYYWLGHGAPKDVSKAYFWSVLGRAEGKEASKVRVAFMTSQLTRAQAEAIQREAEKFLRLHPPLTNSENPY
jgi:putative methionine-R-sulfoxide reductase with GAF domain